MEGLIVSIPAWIYVMLFVGAVCVAAWLFASVRSVGGAIVSILVAVVFVILTFSSCTGFIVPINERGLVVNTVEGKVVGDILPSGIHHKDLLNTTFYTYPGGSEQEWCALYTPSVVGALGVTLNLCLYYDAANVNWKQEVISTGKVNKDEILAYWQNQLRTIVAGVIKDSRSTELTAKRPDVEGKLFEQLGQWFTKRGITLIRVNLANWEYTDQAVKDAFNLSAVNQAGLDQAQADLQKAQAEREVALFRADTQVQVLTQLANGQTLALNTLGIEDDQARAWFLIQRDIINLLATNPGASIVVSVGGQPVTVPGNSAPTPPPG